MLLSKNIILYIFLRKNDNKMVEIRKNTTNFEGSWCYTAKKCEGFTYLSYCPKTSPRGKTSMNLKCQTLERNQCCPYPISVSRLPEVHIGLELRPGRQIQWQKGNLLSWHYLVNSIASMFLSIERQLSKGFLCIGLALQGLTTEFVIQHLLPTFL